VSGFDRELDDLLAEQVRYYDDRAPEYEDWWYRRGPYDRGPEWNAEWFRQTAAAEAAVDALKVRGTFLELACGSGLWTRRLAPRADRLVAVDTSASMLALNADRVGKSNVEFVCADLFEWEPPVGERFDLIFFGFFLSHVPPARFEMFWRRLCGWVAGDGRVAFVDDRAGPDRPRSSAVVPGGPSFAHRRRLDDGREYTIVKVFHGPDDLADAIGSLGWDAEVVALGGDLLFGTARGCV
jgi:demethylmenaquinone methyltransferase/2-methoxy-6-polyprenyl-1,4-benzoquinol methylase